MSSKSELTKKILTKPTVLSKDQKRAVLSKSRYNRIIAGAGAGKTETLTRRIAYLLAVKQVPPSSIVAFTFTEKAAQSMKSRIYQRVGEISGEAATANLGEMYIGTIHAYAKRVLEDHFSFGNYTVLDDNQEIAFLMRHGFGLGLREYERFYAEACRTFLRTVNMVWDELLDTKKLEKKAPTFFERMMRYEDLLNDHRLLTFGRLIHEAVLKLKEAPNTLKHVSHLIVDEFQDINRAQAEFIALVGKQADIFVVGDPRQSIYQWRGSDEMFFDRFSEKYPDTNLIAINENRRSGKKIVKNANNFAKTFSRGNYEAMAATRDDEGFVGISSHETAQDEARWIVDQIQQLTKKNPELKLSDIGILTRSVSTSARALIQELKVRDITYIVGGKVGLFQRSEAQALGRIFAWLADDGFWNEDAWNWSARTTGEDLLTSGIANWDIAHAHSHPKNAMANLRKIKNDLRLAKSEYHNFTKIYYDILTALGYEQLDYKNRNDAAVMANLGRFNNLLTDYESANRFGGRKDNWSRDLTGLCWFMNSYGLSAYEEQPSDDIRGVDAVQVMTVHQAKGLEWPIVFLFATINRRFPASRVGSQRNWCSVPRELFDAERYEGDLDDERRLFYVAITRSKDALVVTHFRKLSNAVRPSEFIEDMETSVIDNLLDEEALPALNLHPGVASDEIQTFTASEIITYSVCPHMYLLRELWGYQPQFDQAIGYGNGLHYCLKRASDHIKNGDDPVNAIAKSVDEDFHMPFVGGIVFDNFKNSAKQKLVNFAQKNGDDLNRIEEVEYRLEYPILNATIMGKVDVIMREKSGLEIRDYKSSEEARTFEEISIQIRLYTSGLRNMGRPISSGSVAYLDEASVKTVDVSDLLLISAKQNAEKVVDKITKGKFKPKPGKSCQRCDQKPICRWRR